MSSPGVFWPEFDGDRRGSTLPKGKISGLSSKRFPMLQRLIVAASLLLAAGTASGQDLSAPTRSAKTDGRLATAAANRDTTAVRALLAQKVDVNAPDVQGTPALHWAIRVDDIDLVRLLLSAGADARLANRYGLTPLTLAVTGGNPAIIRLMLDRKSTRLNSSHSQISYAVFCLKKKKRIDLRLLLEHHGVYHS